MATRNSTFCLPIEKAQFPAAPRRSLHETSAAKPVRGRSPKAPNGPTVIFILFLTIILIILLLRLSYCKTSYILQHRCRSSGCILKEYPPIPLQLKIQHTACIILAKYTRIRIQTTVYPLWWQNFSFKKNGEKETNISQSKKTIENTNLAKSNRKVKIGLSIILVQTPEILRSAHYPTKEHDQGIF